jgi:hypothetical protein
MRKAAEGALDDFEISGVESDQGFLCDLDALSHGQGCDLGDDFGGAHG